ncbi:MAG: TSUP family transporter, partial [Chitinophagaceae bacterium]|nr:TSUP family transporter [Chitinophagaceae bacterium]
PAFSGTSLAAAQYVRRVKINVYLLLVMGIVAFCAAFLGSTLLTMVSNRFMKPVLLIVLSAVAVYTYRKKNFGQHQQKLHTPRRQLMLGILLSVVIGFYDGFIGPGTGSFLVLGFIAILGFDFLHASAYAKMVNLSTNFGSIVLFTLKGKIIWTIALPMAASNALGGFLGSRMALTKGNGFIRKFFLVVVTGTLLRFAWDIFRP